MRPWVVLFVFSHGNGHLSEVLRLLKLDDVGGDSVLSAPLGTPTSASLILSNLALHGVDRVRWVRSLASLLAARAILRLSRVWHGVIIDGTRVNCVLVSLIWLGSIYILIQKWGIVVLTGSSNLLGACASWLYLIEGVRAIEKVVTSRG